MIDNVDVLVRWSEGEAGLTGWGKFWLLLLLWAIW